MNILNRTIHPVLQGTGAWLSLREGHDTASEAPAALGVSLYQTRAALLRQKHTGLSAEHSAATLGKFAAGHAAEADARPLAEAMVGEDLFPVTMTAEADGLRLLASLDGQTMDGREIWETKLWNESLAAAVRVGAHALHEHYRVQMDQQLLVSGALRCLLTCTDGTPERFVSCWYYPQPERFAALVAGWKQVHADLAVYVLPADAEPAPVGRAPETLPALRIEVTGEVTASNLAEFKETALAAIRSVNRELQTDQDFADAERSVKWCAEVEARLKAAKEHALSQTASIDALFKALDDIGAEARAVRLDLDRLVKRRKDEVREQAVLAARRALDDHVAALQAELAPLRRLLPVPADFAGAIKGLRSIASMQDALDTTLAGAKIAADAQARAIRANLATFHSRAAGVEFLFSDLGTIVHKAADDFAAVVDTRIAKHRADEAAREAKRQADEAARIAEAERRAREQEAARIAAVAATQAASRNSGGQHPQQVLKAEPATADATDRGMPADVSPRGGAMGAGQAAAAAPAAMPTSVPESAADEPAILRLGTICERLGVQMTAEFVAGTLNIKPAKVAGAARLYTEAQYQRICAALISHTRAAAMLYAPEEVTR